MSSANSARLACTLVYANDQAGNPHTVAVVVENATEICVAIRDTGAVPGFTELQQAGLPRLVTRIFSAAAENQEPCWQFQGGLINSVRRQVEPEPSVDFGEDPDCGGLRWCYHANIGAWERLAGRIDHTPGHRLGKARHCREDS